MKLHNQDPLTDPVISNQPNWILIICTLTMPKDNEALKVNIRSWVPPHRSDHFLVSSMGRKWRKPGEFYHMILGGRSDHFPVSSTPTKLTSFGSLLGGRSDHFPVSSTPIKLTASVVILCWKMMNCWSENKIK